MSLTVDYYFATQSPWAYLGHDRFVAMAKAANAKVNVRPADLGKIFPISGGLPLGKRAPQRQAYRLVELKRFSDFLQIPLHVQPQFFPVAGDPTARLIVAADMEAGQEAALRLSGAVFKCVWAQQRDIADVGVHAELLNECGLPSDLLVLSQGAAVQAQYDACTQAAIDVAAFGSPTYVIDGEVFWGQDRLDFVQRRLQKGH